MMISLLFFIHYFLILLFGVYLSAAFAGIPFTKKNSLICLGFCFLCGVIQLAAYMAFSEDMVWKTKSGNAYHKTNHCGNTNPANCTQISLDQASKMGLHACGNCYR